MKLGNFDFERLSPANLYNSYLGMSAREQTFTLVAAAVILVLVIILPVTMAIGKLSSLNSEIDDGREKMSNIVGEIESYNKIQAQYDSLRKRLISNYGVSISTVLENMAEKAGIKDKIDSLKEVGGKEADMEELSVDVRLRKVSLPELVNFLYEIENYKDANFRLKQLEVRTRYDNKQELNVSFTVSTFQVPSESGA
ncbi:MAG: hypothetical protein ABIE74_01195 [Pseudomonadota bacterium]